MTSPALRVETELLKSTIPTTDFWALDRVMLSTPVVSVIASHPQAFDRSKA
jgi:hypothetical protein